MVDFYVNGFKLGKQEESVEFKRKKFKKDVVIEYNCWRHGCYRRGDTWRGEPGGVHLG